MVFVPVWNMFSPASLQPHPYPFPHLDVVHCLSSKHTLVSVGMACCLRQWDMGSRTNTSFEHNCATAHAPAVGYAPDGAGTATPGTPAPRALPRCLFGRQCPACGIPAVLSLPAHRQLLLAGASRMCFRLLATRACCAISALPACLRAQLLHFALGYCRIVPCMGRGGHWFNARHRLRLRLRPVVTSSTMARTTLRRYRHQDGAVALSPFAAAPRVAFWQSGVTARAGTPRTHGTRYGTTCPSLPTFYHYHYHPAPLPVTTMTYLLSPGFIPTLMTFDLLVCLLAVVKHAYAAV